MPQVVNLKNKNKTEVPEPMPPKRVSEEYEQSIDIGEISWQAPEYVQYVKSRDWYWAVGILTAGFFVTALIFENILFGIFVLLAGFAIALYGVRPPQTVMFSVSVSGVRIGNRVYPYETLRSFWIFYQPDDIKELSVESQKMIMPHIKIPLGDANPARVRAYLRQFLPERPQEESLIDIASRYLRF